LRVTIRILRVTDKKRHEKYVCKKAEKEAAEAAEAREGKA